MNEKEWVKSIIPSIETEIQKKKKQLFVRDGIDLPYAYEVTSYSDQGPEQPRSTVFETDILIGEYRDNGTWIPRVVIEVKLGGVTTHDAITYSQKAMAHKNVHPYLRYGILIGNIKNIPGRLVRHGQNFDFMQTWDTMMPTTSQIIAFTKILIIEVKTSVAMENLIFHSRIREVEKPSLIHRMTKII